jgi:hypothetical protein
LANPKATTHRLAYLALPSSSHKNSYSFSQAPKSPSTLSSSSSPISSRKTSNHNHNSSLSSKLPSISNHIACQLVPTI